MVGESRDLDVRPARVCSEPAVRCELGSERLGGGRLRGYAALDYFVFPKRPFDPCRPF